MMNRETETAGVTIRDARPGDEPVVIELIRELARTEAVESGVTVELLRDYQARDDSGILVAELGGEVVGMLSFFVRPGLFHGGHWGCLDELIVTATAQGKGIGDALMSAVMSRFEAAGCVEAAVSTVFGNDRAAALYRKHGLVDEALQLEKHF
jgi:ribosomal protein S18 acetylase RimI-like enzyme